MIAGLLQTLRLLEAKKQLFQIYKFKKPNCDLFTQYIILTYHGIRLYLFEKTPSYTEKKKSKVMEKDQNADHADHSETVSLE